MGLQLISGTSATRRVAAKRGTRSSRGASRNAAPRKSHKRLAMWLNRLLVFAALGCAGAIVTEGWVWLQALPVKHIIVSGEMQHTRSEAVKATVRPALHGGFLSVDLQHIRLELEKLPWIYRATVRRRWPNALEIFVDEQLPIARWGKLAYLNHEGEVFRPEDSALWSSLPLLEGPEGSARSAMAAYQLLVDALAPLNLAVARLSLDELGDMEAELESGATLVLGRQDIADRLRRFSVIYRAALIDRSADLQRIDLRYETGLAVAYRAVSTVAGR